MVEKILEALWRINQYTEAYYNLKTGEIVFQNDFFPDSIEEIESDEFVRLPTQREIDEYSMMQAFALQQKEKPRIFLTECLKKKGAYRRFKEMIVRLNLQKNWYKYRDERYLEIARNWCKKYNLNNCT